MGLKHQMKEKQKHKNAAASEDNAPDPSCLHVVEVIARGDDGIRVFASPSQHARITVARAVKVGELEYTRQDDTEGVAARSQYRQPTQERSEAFGHGDGVEFRARDAAFVPHFGVMGEVAG